MTKRTPTALAGSGDAPGLFYPESPTRTQLQALRSVSDHGDWLLLNATLIHCRVCGCTEINACRGALGGCYWVEPGLCSVCAPADHPGLMRFADGRFVR